MHRLLPLSLLLCVATAHAGEPVRVMSFNIRYGTANDGEDHWKNRKELVVETIRQFDPDLLGTQETLAFQAEFINGRLEQYERVGRSREADDGPDGEQCTVFFKRDRFANLEHGHLWLSETPNQPGSKSWDSSLPRMATWVRLRDKKTDKELYLVNTHFDHRGPQARLESAKLLRKFIVGLGSEKRVVLTGDFNCGEHSEPHQAMFPDNADEVRDTYRVAHREKSDPEGTFNGFRGRDSGPRIDWIAVTANLNVEAAEIVSFNKDGRYPSDHFPVTAVLQ